MLRIIQKHCSSWNVAILLTSLRCRHVQQLFDKEPLRTSKAALIPLSLVRNFWSCWCLCVFLQFCINKCLKKLFVSASGFGAEHGLIQESAVFQPIRTQCWVSLWFKLFLSAASGDPVHQKSSRQVDHSKVPL